MTSSDNSSGGSTNYQAGGQKHVSQDGTIGDRPIPAPRSIDADPQQSANFSVWHAVVDAIRPYSCIYLGNPRSIAQSLLFLVSAPRDRRFAKTGPSQDFEQISIAIYLDTDHDAAHSRVTGAVDHLRFVLGYGDEDDVEVARGSIFRRSRAKLRRVVGSDEIQQRLIKIERAVELVVLGTKQAEVDSAQAGAVREVIEALIGVDRAAVRVGSI